MDNFITFSGSVAAGKIVSFNDNSALAFLNGKIGACESEINRKYDPTGGKADKDGWISNSVIQYMISPHYNYWDDQYQRDFNGAKLNVKYDGNLNGLSDLNWIQSVTFVKSGYKEKTFADGDPFYFTFFLHSLKANNNNTNAYFEDSPRKISFDVELFI